MSKFAVVIRDDYDGTQVRWLTAKSYVKARLEAIKWVKKRIANGLTVEYARIISVVDDITAKVNDGK